MRPTAALDESSAPVFADAEGLRAVLVRLHRAGPGGWRTDAEAAALMRFAADRYAALARKYGQEPADAAAAAFEAMRTTSTRTAADPWAVVTVAVRTTLIAEQRAHGLLTSVDRARRRQYAASHDAQRFCDHDIELARHHPALATADPSSDFDGEAAGEPWVLVQTIELLVVLGWPADTAATLVCYVCQRLADIGDRHGAYETLRRDKALRASLDLPQHCWTGLLRIVLGHAGAGGVLRHGLLARLLVGDTVADLLGDDDVVRAAAAANPTLQPDLAR